MSVTITFAPNGGSLGTILLNGDYSMFNTDVSVTVTNTTITSGNASNVNATDLASFVQIQFPDFTFAQYLFTGTASESPPPDGLVTFNLQVVTANGTFTSPQFSITVILPCIATNAEILLMNGQYKLIQDIVRGDLVASDQNFTKEHRVARINKITLEKNTELNVCEFSFGSISKNTPSKLLMMTEGHPIIYNKERKPAYAFKNFSGVRVFKNSKAKDVLPDLDSNYYLWDLQFETVGTYVANNVVIQSRNPRSFLTPLPKELYFDESLYTDELHDDHDPANEFPLITNIM